MNATTAILIFVAYWAFVIGGATLVHKWNRRRRIEEKHKGTKGRE